MIEAEVEEKAVLNVSHEQRNEDNLLETEKCFAIGKDKVDEFVNYVTKNCDGYVYVYDVDEDGEQSVSEIPVNVE